MSSTLIHGLLEREFSTITYAELDDKLIGYAIAIQKKIPYIGLISWVTQLVVHEEHRQKHIGKKLLFSIWGFSSNFAWGVITASPYAIRALEKATRRRCLPLRIKKHKDKLIKFGRDNVSYVHENTEVIINRNVSKINTEFFVDHTDVENMIRTVTNHERPWKLGLIEEGWEWFAFTFHDQEQIGLTSYEIEEMLNAADQITRNAYSRMTVNKSHVWAQHTKYEVDQIIDYCDAVQNQTILDLGCGQGRHTIELALRGFKVTGVDYIKDFIDSADSYSKKRNIQNAYFVEGDCRNIDLKEKYDIVLCLYDVVGTYADNCENQKILKNIFHHLKQGGDALISVMNFEFTKQKATNFFSILKEPDALLNLPASHTMERTGDIFNPKYFMIDSDTNIVYRKEQFTEGTLLPEELIVRDRRFYKEEIEQMCKEAGLSVIWSKFVRSGDWNQIQSPDQGKEILLLCKKI